MQIAAPIRFSIICGLMGFIAGGIVTSIIQYSIKPAVPFSLGEARAVMTALRPLMRNTDKTSAHLYLWADSSVNIKVDLTYFTTITGQGNSIREAAADMMKQSSAVSDALSIKQ